MPERTSSCAVEPDRIFFAANPKRPVVVTKRTRASCEAIVRTLREHGAWFGEEVDTITGELVARYYGARWVPV